MGHVAIFGAGLIGTSLGMALRRNGAAVRGWDPNRETAERAARRGAFDQVCDDQRQAALSAETVVLAGPLRATVETLGELRTDGLVTDVAGVKTPVDELLIAGAVRGRGVEVCRGRTVDVAVPAAAEIVVEGHLHPARRESEGPLAEFHGYHGEPWNSPTFEVSCISWRNEPIYQTIIPGWYEHVYIGNVLPREPLLRRFVRHLDPTADVHIPPYANGFLAVIRIDRDNPGTPKNLALAALAAHINVRNVIVVDRDVDIHEPSEIQWALTNRVHWTDDVFVVPGAQGHEMDPVADQRGVGTKVGIDATYKRERREYGERVSYPAVDLSPYLT